MRWRVLVPAAVLVLAAVVLVQQGTSRDPRAVAAASPASAEASTTTTSTLPVPPGGRRPTVSDPLRVVLFGDSVMVDLSWPVLDALNKGGQVESAMFLVPSLIRDSSVRFTIRRSLTEQRPDLVVMLVGTWESIFAMNDAEAAGVDYGSPAWLSRYMAETARPWADLVAASGAKLLWVGMPAVGDEARTYHFAFLNQAYRQLDAERADVAFLEGQRVLGGPEGAYTAFGPGPDGREQRWRRVDGLHLCPDGSVRLARPVLDWITRQWGVPLAQGWENGSWRTRPEFPPEECPEP